MNKSFALLLSVAYCLLSILSSCKYKNEYQAINTNNKFIISIPSWMKEEKGLKEGAPFQYANRFRNFYAIAETLPKADSANSVSSIMNFNLNVIRKAMSNSVVTDSVLVNGVDIKGTRAEIYGKMNNENIYFSEVLYEGKSNIYHLSIWTRSEDRKLHFKEDINKIIESFKEI